MGTIIGFIGEAIVWLFYDVVWSFFVSLFLPEREERRRKRGRSRG